MAARLDTAIDSGTRNQSPSRVMTASTHLVLAVEAHRAYENQPSARRSLARFFRPAVCADARTASALTEAGLSNARNPICIPVLPHLPQTSWHLEPDLLTSALGTDVNDVLA